MPRYPELYLLRHGQTTWNAEGRLQGALNSPLTALGRSHAEAQGRILAGLDLTGFEAISSPLGRTIETAGFAVAPLMRAIRTDDRLREIEMGDWSGRLREVLETRHDPNDPPRGGGDDMLALYENAPGGEGLVRLEARCRAFLEELSGPAVLITHGITGRMLRCLHLGLSREAFSRLPGGQGIVFHVREGRHAVLREDGREETAL